MNQEQLKAICLTLPAQSARVYLPFLVAAMIEFGITTRKRATAFLAQLGHESIDLKAWSENLNYSASGLLRIFPRYFNQTQATEYARSPQRIANRVYANRMGNGNEFSGDGYKYRGRSPTHLTGKDNYARAGRALGLPLVEQPELAERAEIGFRIAGWFWKSNGLNELADGLTGSGDAADIAQFDKLTRRINGGQNGQADRRQRYQRARRELPADYALRRAAPAPAPATISAPSSPSAVSGDTQPAPAQKPTPQATQAQGTATPAIGEQPIDLAAELESIPLNDKTLTAGQVAARGAGKAAAKPLAWLFAALAAGNLWAWLTVIVLALALGWYAYTRREAIKSALARVLRKVKGAL